MSEQLHTLLTDNRKELIKTLMRQLKNSHTPHYEIVGSQQLLKRCTQLVDAFMKAATGTPSLFIDYIKRITEERIREGYYLDEIQLALNILEAQSWELSIGNSNMPDVLEHLSIITGVIGNAKDQLARILRSNSAGTDACRFSARWQLWQPHRLYPWHELHHGR